MQNWLFISDLHLAPERPEMIKLFCRFVDEVACSADRLYILGDFVEYWIGDDDRAEGLKEVFSAFERLHDAETSVFMMHGNRDFLMGSELAGRCHFELIEDPFPIQLQNQASLLMHGDTLCTDDIDYQKFRVMVRNKEWQNDFLSKTLQQREQIALSLREKSQLATAEKAPDIMDVNQDAVIETMRQHGVSTLIHGHTHRQATHEFEIDGAAVKRIVLGDWYKTGNYLKVSGEDEPVLITFS
jgi:UDP-2,3-diacylglucosamine hydrolase